MSAHDRWLDGPPVTCDGCGEGLGRLQDGRGEQEDGTRLCPGCEVDAEEARREATDWGSYLRALRTGGEG